jgi:RHS repeat-associated protein
MGKSGTAFTASDTISYGYNDRSEVTSASSANDSTYNFSFNFDDIGNREDYTTNETGSAVTTSYTTNELNQYTSITNPNQSPTYDDDGNMLTMTLSSGSWTNTYNAENRIISMETSTQKLEFTYDYIGRRVEKKVYSGSTGNWTLSEHKRFVYYNFEQIEEVDALNSNAITNKRIWSGGKLICDIRNNTLYYALGDANKNITDYVDASGTIQAHYEYSQFGKITASSGSGASDFDYRFSSEAFATETGLVYYNYSYYSPELGRWMKRDMIGEMGGENLYGMVRNDAINRFDYLGNDYTWWDLVQFFKWIFDITSSPVVLPWSDFDPDGSDKQALINQWKADNFSTLQAICESAPDGASEHNVLANKAAYIYPLYSESHAWISKWHGYAYTDQPIGLDKDPETCICTFEVGLDFLAKDTADFNWGNSFGPWDIFKDKWFIMFHDATWLGFDYEITSSDYSLENITIPYGEPCTDDGGGASGGSH